MSKFKIKIIDNNHKDGKVFLYNMVYRVLFKIEPNGYGSKIFREKVGEPFGDGREVTHLIGKYGVTLDGYSRIDGYPLFSYEYDMIDEDGKFKSEVIESIRGELNNIGIKNKVSGEVVNLKSSLILIKPMGNNFLLNSAKPMMDKCKHGDRFFGIEDIYEIYYMSCYSYNMRFHSIVSESGDEYIYNDKDTDIDRFLKVSFRQERLNKLLRDE